MAEIGYVTVEAANDYVTRYFTSNDPLRLAWEELSGEDREVLLRRSFESIELLPYTGRKSEIAQPNAFPRYPSCKVPPAVMHAQIENAVALTDKSATEEASFYGRLRQLGVESYSIGNLSETLGPGSWSGSSAEASGVVSAQALRLLRPYMLGGYCIRGGRRR